MLKIIIISNNVNFIKETIHSLKTQGLNYEIDDISKNIKDIIKTPVITPAHIILIDKAVINGKNDKLYELFSSQVLITSFDDISTTLSLQINQNLIEKLSNNDLPEIKEKIIKELTYIGYNLKYKGSLYLIDVILISYLYKNHVTDNLQGFIYPIISKKYNKCIQSIKNDILNATNYMYYTCDVEKLKIYFSFYDDIKPSVKDVVSTVLNKL